MADPVRQVALDVADLAIGTAAGVARVAVPSAVVALRIGQRLARRGPGRVLWENGRALRDRARITAVAWFAVVVPATMDAVLDRVDVTDVVIARVDLDRVAQELDLDALLDRIDLTGLVLTRVDLNRLARQLDVDAVVERVDLDAAVERLDVDAVVDRVDLDGVVGRLDLIALAEYVVDGIDLPKIIRESTGSVASEGLRQVRLTSFEADRALAQFVDRMMLRRGGRAEGPSGHRA